LIESSVMMEQKFLQSEQDLKAQFKRDLEKFWLFLERWSRRFLHIKNIIKKNSQKRESDHSMASIKISYIFSHFMNNQTTSLLNFGLQSWKKSVQEMKNLEIEREREEILYQMSQIEIERKRKVF